MNKYGFKNLFNFLKFLKPYWKKEVFVWLLTFIVSLLSLVNPIIAKLIIDRAYLGRDLGIFIKLVILAGLIFVISNIADIVSQLISEYIASRTKFDLQKKIFRKIDNLSYSFFQKKTSGEYIYRINNEAAQVATFMTTFFPRLLDIIPRLLLTIAILLYLNWKICVLILVLTLFLYIPNLLLIKKIMKKSQQLLESAQDILETAREIFSNMQVVKIFAKEKYENRTFISRLINDLRIEIADARLQLWSSVINNWINRLILAAITIYGGYSIIKGSMTLGSFTAIMMYIGQLVGLQGTLSSFFVSFSIGNISINRIAEILDSWPQEAEDKDARDYLLPSGRIEFQGVSFGYYPDKNVVDNLSFKIDGGLSVGLVGASGTGKTTIVNLAVKLYPISRGKIFIGDKDIKFIKNNSLRSQIGMAMQKPILWNDTVHNNLIYGNPKATKDEIERACRIACADEFIRDLPQQLQTTVDEAAIRLSEGQKQRISLARAIIKNPKILIIDEGMSSLDSQTEDRIIDNLRRECRDKTIVVVSHRLSTVKKLDLIYFLEAKDRISIGSHAQLVKDNARYKALFASQLVEEGLSLKFDV
ncbi:MAG TPA: ABC transporter ATP-binding protein [Candidatus Omnitrophota bacterium]|nr:ABC transporter ATP-binding protein [Candidatus Omnitrophota bacterium]